MASFAIQHPSNARHKVSRLRLLLGLFGAPTAWAGQILLSTILSSHACYPRSVPLHAPLWGWLHWALVGISLACFAFGLFCACLAWTGWRRSRYESKGAGKHVMEAGEGRTRFLSLIGVLISLLFMVAISFTAFALLLLGTPC